MIFRVITLLTFLTMTPIIANAANIDDIKKEIIRKSVDAYPGRCACPYSTDSRGHQCGKRSAYTRAGGYSVNCYPKDVSDEDIRLYKLKNKSNY